VDPGLLGWTAMRGFIVVACVLGGCVAGPEDGGGTQAEQSELSEPTAFANDQPAFTFFVSKGLTTFQAAGIVGNLDQESGVNPNSVQSGGPGRGIAQWSVGGRWDTSAGDNATAYAAQQGENVHSLNLQLEFIWYELTTHGYGYNELRATTNVTDATIVFMQKYEICGNCVSSQRVNYAKAVLTQYGQIPYGASYVSQSWPLASAPALQVKCGESVAATITLKNTGTMAWNGSTKLGTTEPRDRASIFAGADWDAPNRAAAISGTVAPGANGTFTFAFDGPTGAACVPGTYHEHFGLVQDGTAWFSDNGGGGPPDDQIEALIELVPGDGMTGSDGGSNTGSDGGGGGDDTGGQTAGCNAGGASGFGSLVLVGAALVRRRRR
jgi:uncharacterized protein (TIGR03382 family)